MLSEAVQLYFSIVKVIGAAADAHMRVFYCLGWGKVQFDVLPTKKCRFKAFKIVPFVGSCKESYRLCDSLSY